MINNERNLRLRALEDQLMSKERDVRTLSDNQRIMLQERNELEEKVFMLNERIDALLMKETDLQEELNDIQKVNY